MSVYILDYKHITELRCLLLRGGMANFLAQNLKFSEKSLTKFTIINQTYG